MRAHTIWKFVVGASACFGLLGVGTGSASSIPSYGISTNGYANAPAGTGLSWDNGGFQQVLSFSQPLLSYANALEPGGGSGAAEVSFAAHNGVLSAFANDSASVPSLGQFGGSNSSFYGNWIDTITIGGLPAGTEVELLLTNYLHADITSDGTVTGDAQSLFALTTVGLGGTIGSAPNETINASSPTAYASGTATVNVLSGSTYQIEFQLVGAGSASAGGASGLSSSVTVDALDTGEAYIDVLTPGATYTTASGFTYSSTPEPSTLILTGLAAFIGLAIQRRYRRLPGRAER